MSVEADAGGAIVLVADLAFFDGDCGAYDVDSEPGKGDPCEDDHAELTLVAGESDAARGCPAPVEIAASAVPSVEQQRLTIAVRISRVDPDPDFLLRDRNSPPG